MHCCDSNPKPQALWLTLELTPSDSIFSTVYTVYSAYSDIWMCCWEPRLSYTTGAHFKVFILCPLFACKWFSKVLDPESPLIRLKWDREGEPHGVCWFTLCQGPRVTLTCMSVDCAPACICIMCRYFRSCLAEFVTARVSTGAETYNGAKRSNLPTGRLLVELHNTDCLKLTYFVSHIPPKLSTPPHPVNLMPFTCASLSPPFPGLLRLTFSFLSRASTRHLPPSVRTPRFSRAWRDWNNYWTVLKLLKRTRFPQITSKLWFKPPFPFRCNICDKGAYPFNC